MTKETKYFSKDRLLLKIFSTELLNDTISAKLTASSSLLGGGSSDPWLEEESGRMRPASLEPPRSWRVVTGDLHRLMPPSTRCLPENVPSNRVTVLHSGTPRHIYISYTSTHTNIYLENTPIDLRSYLDFFSWCS